MLAILQLSRVCIPTAPNRQRPKLYLSEQVYGSARHPQKRLSSNSKGAQRHGIRQRGRLLILTAGSSNGEQDLSIIRKNLLKKHLQKPQPDSTTLASNAVPAPPKPSTNEDKSSAMASSSKAVGNLSESSELVAEPVWSRPSSSSSSTKTRPQSAGRTLPAPQTADGSHGAITSRRNNSTAGAAASAGKRRRHRYTWIPERRQALRQLRWKEELLPIARRYGLDVFKTKADVVTDLLRREYSGFLWQRRKTLMSLPSVEYLVPLARSYDIDPYGYQDELAERVLDHEFDKLTAVRRTELSGWDPMDLVASARSSGFDLTADAAVLVGRILAYEARQQLTNNTGTVDEPVLVQANAT